MCAYALCLIPNAVRACVRGREESEEETLYVVCERVHELVLYVRSIVHIMHFVLMGACVEIDASVFLM